MRPRIKVEIVMPKFSPVFWMLLALNTEVGTSTAPQPLPVYLPSFPAWFCKSYVPSHGRARNGGAGWSNSSSVVRWYSLNSASLEPLWRKGFSVARVTCKTLLFSNVVGIFHSEMLRLEGQMV